MTTRRFTNALRCVINEHSRESASNTPDFVLARFLAQSLEAFDLAVEHRDDWYAVDEVAEEATQIKASLLVLAKAAVVCIVGTKLAHGHAREELIAALNLPRVQDALKEGS